MGTTINGSDDSDRLGYAVAISEEGNTIAVSVPGVDNPTIQVGRVRIFNFENGDWSQKGNDINTSGGYEFGWTIDLDLLGNEVAITSIGGAGGDVVYEWDGTNWNQKGQLFSEVNDFSPFSVALSGDGTRVAFGSPNLFDLVDEPGSVYVYSWNGTDWSLLGNPIVADEIYNDFGAAVATTLDGDRVAIGIPEYWDSNFDRRGAVMVFDYVGGAWQQVGSTLIGEEEYDEFGADLKLSTQGNSLIVGAEGNDNAGGSNAGQVRVFDWNGSDWEQRGMDIDGVNFNEKAGASVAISGDGEKILIASPANSEVRYYEWSNISATKDPTELRYSFGPNPTYDKVTIKFEEKINNIEIEVIDILGRKRLVQSYNSISELDVALPELEGAYLIKLSTKEGYKVTLPILKHN